MLRWIALLFATCAASGTAGLGYLGSIDGTARGWCLALTALTGMLLISSCDAYETEASAVRTPDED